MRRRRLSRSLFVLVGAAVSGAGVAASCSATGVRGEGGEGGAGGDDLVTGGVGGFILDDGEGGLGEASDVAVNPCGSACGPRELCSAENIGLDDDCDGEIDEDCGCLPGQAHACFRGDPSFQSREGCFPGTQLCGETGTWGPCLGGLHADERCYDRVQVCQPMQARPFADLDLKEGTGAFSADAVPGSERWTVTCPAGVDPCPAVGGAEPADDFKPLQSGEYSVLYTKQVADGTTQRCRYPLFVGARGLRVELEWEHDLGDVDLDLHLHRPNDTRPWSTTGSEVDCGWKNCTVEHLSYRSQIRWFSDSATPPDPVNWFLDPEEINNTCFFAPRGVGALWREKGLGCHNPRLDLDNAKCDPAVDDPNDPEFCAPENINLDFPPKGRWMRIGVHYYGEGGVTGDVHPRIKIFCDGALGADLGHTGFYEPEQPVAFAPADARKRFWLVADVVFPKPGACGEQTCIVQPLYEDAALKTPLLTTRADAETSFGPDYPALP